MSDARIDSLRRMADRHPDDPRPLFGLALEYEKAGRWEDAAATLRTYLDLAEDEGNAWGRLATALDQMGRHDEAKAALRNGIDAAHRHGHPTMAAEFEERLGENG